jgi:hypothetical protein
MSSVVTRRMYRLASIASGIISAFFLFYLLRLLAVTKMLTEIRPGGGGTFIGAIAFPLLSAVFGSVAWRLWRVAGKIAGGDDR